MVAGIALGMLSLVRPLEGLIVAALLGFWSLGARGARWRLAPSACLTVATALTASTVAPYNAAITGDASRAPIMAYVDRYYAPGANDLGFGANRGMGWSGLDPFPGHGVPDVVVNSALNLSQIDVELLGWPVGALALVVLALLQPAERRRRADWWMVAAVVAVSGAHAFYWFSGGPDFGARYWFLAIVPLTALAARGVLWLDASDGSRRSAGVSLALCLAAVTMLVYVPWRSVGKYHGYRGMRPEVRRLASELEWGSSLILVRGARFPDYASAAVENPIDLRAPQPVFAWDADPEARAGVLRAYADRPVWLLDGPSITGAGYRVRAGPVPASALLEVDQGDAAPSGTMREGARP